MSECQISSEKLPYTINSINALTDNYIWVIGQEHHNKIAIVDPGDADACIDYIKKNHLEVTDILITHRHYDHTDGVDKLMNYCQEKNWKVTLYGPSLDNLPFKSHFKPMHDGDEIILGFSDGPNQPNPVKILSLFGHTKGQIGYLADDALFCADAIFSAGCGRLFDGTIKQLWRSLKKISDLPDKTQLYCAHEYTVANLNFALTIEPENEELIHYFNIVTKRRSNNLSTIPTSLLQEKKINPFIRCHLPIVQKNIADVTTEPYISELETFTLLRKLKDNF